MDSHRSSGDLLADRRYRYAEACLAEGDAAACADLAGQAIEIAPRFAAAWLLLGRAREALSATADARAAYEAARRLDPADTLGAGLHLARLGDDGRGALTPAYIRALFDGYAPRFEHHLVEGLHYVGPALVAGVLPEEPAIFPAVLDLGCGTGLAGAALRGRAGHLTGVDLSPAMLARARTKGCYHRLVEAELGAFLAGEPPGSADLCVAADVFIYCADLRPVLAGIARVLRPGGWAAFTVQSPSSEGEDPLLGADGRHAHPDAHLRAAAAGADLALRVTKEAAVRTEKGVPVPGRVLALQRSPG
ncbi:class I SAM-dependent DNA methyltransferase [Methylobacterium aerolatum]|uniref:TPR repeat methyltransferase n=1 Tax=Methylobacterium aerolatum TaxID=418708 RepID=A0ABU0I546_9HYPH|nr:methyltransferase domain-containing protein [Methylobacterium aerolatum]MDQ0449734.1 putative TPR repeat methyltransferase [Methylobacterium aerolatum]GJD37159.1 Trans-aconitate 2-methyltransferase [Methylobacterium aerolatum]